jgi:alanine racemase
MDAYRVRAEIDLDALTHNLAAIRRRVGPRVAVMLVVKADAYGHGAVAVAHHALRCGIAALGVGTSAEALELRKSGIRAPILVLGTIVDDEAADAVRHDIEIALHSEDRCESLQELAQHLRRSAKVHLKIDSGMGRLGVLPGRALELMERIRASSHLELRGVMTHIAATIGSLHPATSQQMAVFEDLVAAARAADLLGDAWVHAANSACIFTGLDKLNDLVRPGISAYGVLPSHLASEDELRPVMSLATQVVFLKDLPRGAPVGYEATWRAPKPTRIATLPVGYNDGVSWRLSNRGEVLIRGQRAPIVGRVSMDYTSVDVGHITGVSVGDRATLIGSQGEERIGLEDVARQADTIPYEIACAVGKRVERTYHGGEVTLFPQPAPARVDSSAAAANARTETQEGSAPPVVIE